MNDEHPGLELAVRIGIDTGEAVVTFGQGPQIGEHLAGDVVNTASRLQNVATTDTIVVGELTHHASALQFEYRELEPVTVKGKAQPLAIRQPVSICSRAGMDLRERPSTAFVGRLDESPILGHLEAREAPTPLRARPAVTEVDRLLETQPQAPVSGAHVSGCRKDDAARLGSSRGTRTRGERCPRGTRRNDPSET